MLPTYLLYLPHNYQRLILFIFVILFVSLRTQGVQACNVTNTGFNGNYKCKYDGLEAKCKFSCASSPGTTVQGNLNIEYTCKYSTGAFYPKPLPKCIYGELILNKHFP